MQIPAKPIFLIGIMGCGKSYWAKRLGEHFGVPVFDTDFMIEEAAGQTISEIFAGPKGHERFREMERKLLQDTTWPLSSIISCGGGLPCYHHNMDFMLQNGFVIWLNTPLTVLTRRLWKERDHRPLVAKAQTITELENMILGFLQERRPFYERAHLSFDEVPDESIFFRNIEALSAYPPAP
ncbi:MAG: shikimate kinase [Chitinophagaceae bacterium]|nr:shikimate kinase [Chitinophagaceae bacterium]